MNGHQIKPEKVTKPIQLLAAWLAGLIIVDASFLTAAGQLQLPSWVSGALVIAAIVNVPLFLLSIFLLQTKFRPEMQEDTFYSQYLERKYTLERTPVTTPDIEAQSKALAENIIAQIGPAATDRRGPIERLLQNSQLDQLIGRVGDLRTLSELFLRPALWPDIVETYGRSTVFREELNLLRADGVIEFGSEDHREAALTELGRRVAERTQERGQLWQQKVETKIWEEQENILKRKRH